MFQMATPSFTVTDGHFHFWPRQTILVLALSPAFASTRTLRLISRCLCVEAANGLQKSMAALMKIEGQPISYPSRLSTVCLGRVAAGLPIDLVFSDGHIFYIPVRFRIAQGVLLRTCAFCGTRCLHFETHMQQAS